MTNNQQHSDYPPFKYFCHAVGFACHIMGGAMLYASAYIFNSGCEILGVEGVTIISKKEREELSNYRNAKHKKTLSKVFSGMSQKSSN